MGQQGTLLSKLYDVDTITVRCSGGAWYGSFANARQLLGAEEKTTVEDRNRKLRTKVEMEVAEDVARREQEIARLQSEVIAVTAKLEIEDADGTRSGDSDVQELERAIRELKREIADAQKELEHEESPEATQEKYEDTVRLYDEQTVLENSRERQVWLTHPLEPFTITVDFTYGGKTKAAGRGYMRIEIVAFVGIDDSPNGNNAPLDYVEAVPASAAARGSRQSTTTFNYRHGILADDLYSADPIILAEDEFHVDPPSDEKRKAFDELQGPIDKLGESGARDQARKGDATAAQSRGPDRGLGRATAGVVVTKKTAAAPLTAEEEDDDAEQSSRKTTSRELQPCKNSEKYGTAQTRPQGLQIVRDHTDA